LFSNAISTTCGHCENDGDGGSAPGAAHSWVVGSVAAEAAAPPSIAVTNDTQASTPTAR